MIWALNSFSCVGCCLRDRSFKLLWAPIVDGFYVKAIGRRRSWLVPLQFIAGFLMIWAASDPSRLQTWLGGKQYFCVIVGV